MKVYRNKKTGIYHLDIRLNGHRTRPSLNTRNRVEATREAKKKIEELRPRAENRTKIYSFLENYKSYSVNRKAKHTIQCEASIIKIFKSLVVDQYIDTFDKLSCDTFFTSLDSRTRKINDVDVPIIISNRTKNYYIRHLKAIWNVAKTWKMIVVNPWTQVEKFPIPQIPVRVFTEEEQARILDSTESLYPQMWDLVQFYLLTGLRRSEALKLEWTEIDLVLGRITILYAKGDKYRVCPLLKIPRDILQKRLPFVRPFVDMPCADEVTHRFVEIVKSAGISNAKLHDTRKTFGTALARSNVNPYTIMKWLGHTNDDITMAHYIGFDTATARRIDDLGVPKV